MASTTSTAVMTTTLGLTQPSAVEPLQVTFAAIDIEASDWKGDVLAVLVTENDLRRSPTFENAVLDGQLGGGGFLSEALAEEDFAGRSGQSVVLRLQGQGFKRLCLVGLGRDAPSTTAACQSIGESVASIAKSARAGSAAVVLASPGGIQEEFRPDAAAAIASGVVLGLHEDNRYRSESKKVHLKQVNLIGFGYGPEVDHKLKLADHIASGVIFGKDLVNSPANVLTPVVLAEEASKIALTYNDVFTATILDQERCRELKMGSYLGVAAASANPPRFIHLCYKPPGGNIKRKLAIVGKGLTFDSGGYNIKVGPICSIELMKWDMGGSAAVFGAAKALGQIKPPGVEVHFIVAACENMISGTGMRPGDIVTASNGKTIEVNNTDAEGRLTLADALVYACKQGVDKIKLAEWNPEKDLLAMVTDDSKVLLHRFNWQRLWTISPGKCITSICWSPDGKVVALGTEDGLVLLHDVENGKMLRTIKSHDVAVVCLNWTEDEPPSRTDKDDLLSYEDRTTRFFPPAPVMPRVGGLNSGDTGLADENEEAIQAFSSAFCQLFNILSSGDKDGCICFSIFGIFPVGKININKVPIHVQSSQKRTSYRLQDASISKVSLSRNLHELVLLCSGELINTDNLSSSKDISVGLHCLHLDTSIFSNRKNELHQVSQQASSIQDLVEVVRASISMMSKQWSNAMNLFHEKFSALPSLITANGIESSSEDEFLSLLFGTRTSPALHQFLVTSLGEAGLKRIAKAIDSSGKELRIVVSEHLQPAVEIISFRLAELRGLARWRSRFQNIGLDEKLMDGVTERVGMLVVQVERFSRVAATVLYLFQNFFSWVLKCVKILLSEPTDQVPPANSELVVIFLKFLLDKDPIRQLLETDQIFEWDIDTARHVEQLVVFGGFTDTQFLERSLAKQFSELEESLKEAFLMPFTTISSQIHCQGLFPLYPVTSSDALSSTCTASSISFYKDEDSQHSASSYSLTDYTCFKIPDGSLNLRNCIGVVKDFCNSSSTFSTPALSGFLLRIPDEYECVDLSLYKDNQVVLLLSGKSSSESSGKSLMIMLQMENFSFSQLSRTFPANCYSLQELVALELQLDTDYGKVRSIPHPLSTPLAVSASRGVGCVFSSRRHALVYILDEDEDENEDEDAEME